MKHKLTPFFGGLVLLILAGVLLWALRHPAAAQQPPASRVLRFPGDRSLGTLFSLDRATPAVDPVFDDRGPKLFHWWHGFEVVGNRLGQAQGRVSVAAGARLGLVLSAGALEASAAPLDRLQPDQIHAVYAAVSASTGDLANLQPLDAAIPLYLDLDRIDAAAAAKLFTLRGLKGLQVRDARTSAQLELISRLRGLEELALPSPPDNRGLVYLAKLPALRMLALNSPAPDEGLRELKHFPALEYLEVTNADYPCPNFLECPPRLKTLSLHTDTGADGLDNLARFAQLETFICASGITDRGLVPLKEFKSLKRLVLAGGNGGYTDAGAWQLKGLKALEELALEGNITERGLAALCELPNLKRLDLADALDINESGLDSLKQLKRLEWLRLRGEYFADGKPQFYTDASLKVFESMPALKTVILSMRRDITFAALDALLARRPDLQVVFAFDPRPKPAASK